MTPEQYDRAAEKDPVIDVIDHVSDEVAANVQDERDLLDELDRVRAERSAGQPLRRALGHNGRPTAVVLTGRIATRMTRAGARLQHALARALSHEGESVTSIARRFEVSHQRISTILRRDRRIEPEALGEAEG